MSDNYAVNDIQYGIEQETTIGTPLTTTADLLLTTERDIDFALGIDQRNIRKARGLSYQKTGDGQDFRKTNQTPTATLPLEGCADLLIKPLASLLQNVTITGVAPYKYQYDPYAGANNHNIANGDVAGSYAFTLYKRETSTGASSTLIDGCICRSLTLGSKEGEPLIVSAEFVGMEMNTAANLAGLAYTDYAKKVILHSDWTGITIDGSTVSVISWQMTIKNNALSRHYQSQIPTRHILGALDITLDLTIPWSTTDRKAEVKADTDYLFEIWKGSKTGASAEDFYIKCNFVPQDVPESEDNGEHIVSYKAIGAHDGTNPALQIIAATSSARLTAM